MDNFLQLGGLLGQFLGWVTWAVSWVGNLGSFLRLVTWTVSWMGNLGSFLRWETCAVSWAGVLDAAQTRFFGKITGTPLTIHMLRELYWMSDHVHRIKLLGSWTHKLLECTCR